MIFGLEIGMLIAGILALVKGKFTLTKNRVVEGTPARIAGVVMILPLPLAFSIGFVIGFMAGIQRRSFEDIKNTLILMEAGVTIFCLLVTIGIVLLVPSAPKDEEPTDELRQDYP